jgi:hypothetical protein
MGGSVPLPGCCTNPSHLLDSLPLPTAWGAYLLLTSCRIPGVMHLFQQRHVLNPYSVVQLVQTVL